MGIIKTKGIVINEANSKDSDKILTILSPDLGKISVLAKNAKNTNKGILPSSQLFSFSDLMLYKNTSELYILNSAQVIELFYDIRQDIEKFYYCTYICKLVCDISNEEQSFELMQLLLNTLFLYSEGKKENMFLITIFQIRLLRILGFVPKMEKCCLCGNKDITSFSIKNDGGICKECSKQDTGSIEFSNSMINALKYIMYSEPKKIFSFQITDSVLAELKLFIKIYLREKIEKEYDIDKYISEILI